ncbi:hypothetical protein [Paractinoplanes brasiliensis]|uniref:Uncharacterized protein n=1 Tax=Paractinoplanes brasiliensis TaxID=52695 RepID=A0A4R6J981_9ACTN|nr:hypothetical protein [Actinoplanes brasiliensis]TDO32032.1 hypothetical protein C8E87_7473 [Actinoplanes brasiliensis]GID28077.1 hypothetical protein Abr02nite_30600 [Actinoplanes brasiliensis]
MTEDLRALMRAELSGERPPPLGDVVGAAVRDGRRIRRQRRRFAVVAAVSAGLLGVVVSAGFATGAAPRRAVVAEPAGQQPAMPAAPAPAPMTRAGQLSPGSVPVTATPPATGAPERSLAVHSGVERAAGPRKKATTGAMLHLLTELLPPGRASRAAVAADEDLRVQIDLDRGDRAGLLGLTVGRQPTDAARGATATVSIVPVAGDCEQGYLVVSRWPDGTSVRLDAASCAVLTIDEAVRIATDPRWGPVMDADLVDRGNARFGRAPVLAP